MTQIAPATVVVQPQLVPPTISLLNTVQVIDEQDDRWVAGLTYAPEGCSGGGVFSELFCQTFQGGFDKTTKITARSAAVTGTPYGIVVGDTCSTYSRLVADYVGRATRLFLAMESRLIAGELWTGSLGTNVPIAGAPNTTTIGTAVAANKALARVEQSFMDCAPGVRPYIHMRPYVFEIIAAAAQEPQIRREGNRYYTAMDSLIVIDAGYPGTGPTGQAVGATNEWIYATSPVQVRHSEMTVLPDNMAQATDRRTNDVTFYVERAAHASFNYQCCTIALNVNTT